MENLTEQQRLLIAVALSVGILLLYQAFFAPAPPVEKAPEATPTERVQDGAGDPDPFTPDAVSSMGSATGAPSAGAAPVAAPVEAPPSAVERSAREFETESLRGRISNVDGRLERLELADYTESETGEKEARLPVNLVAREGPAAGRQAELVFELEGATAPPLDFVAGEGLNLQGRNNDVRITVDIEPVGYTLRYRIAVANQRQTPLAGAPSFTMGLRQTGGGRSMFSPAADVVSGLCYYDGGVDRDLVSALVDESVSATSNVEWAGIDRQYFVVAAIPRGEGEQSCAMSAVEDTALVSLKLPFENLAPGATWEREVVLFVGPKRDDALEAVSPLLTEAIEYNLWGIPLGAIARPMVWALNLFHGLTGNWGFAIIMLTFVVKAALFPVTYRSAVSMRKMQQLRPEIEKIKKQYENDRERQQLEQMKLFREQGVNPLGGCLPLLLQMPIWFALYRTLWTSVDLYQQPFLWIDDLTAAEPFPILALVVGGMTFLQQRLQPMSMDNQQMKAMMYIMPVMFTFFMFALPSGLVLYILVNSALTIVQQLVINRQR